MRIKNSIMKERLEKVLALKAVGTRTKAIATQLDLTESQVKHCLYRECDNKAVKKWKDNGHKNYYKKRYSRLKALWLKEGTKCVHCDKIATIRHHKIYGEKEFAFKEIYNTNKITEEMIAAEVLKTIPVCISCHRLIHLGKIIDPDLYTGPIQIVLRDGNEFNGVSYDE